MIGVATQTVRCNRSLLPVLAGFLFHGSISFAQVPSPTPADEQNGPAGAEATTVRIIVTGSSIPTAETESALPISIYTAEVWQKQGANTPIEGLRRVPSFVGNTATKTIRTAETVPRRSTFARWVPGIR